jgi:MFS family permease
MTIHYSPIYLLHYFLKREPSQFFTSIAIRSLALGMILIFEPIYLYLYFGKSLSLTLLFFGAAYGLYGLLAVYGGKIMAKIGLCRIILISHFFFFGYYLSLFFIQSFFLLAPLAIILRAVGMMFFWPAFHTDFVRFSEKERQGETVGKMNIVYSAPTIFSPIIGGAVLNLGGYSSLFIAVLVVLLASAIPLFLSKETQTIYTDSYQKAWSRIFKKENRKTNFAFIADSLEYTIDCYLWPLFMFVLSIGYATMGGITTFALAAAAFFTFYMGKMSDTVERPWFLNVGSIWTSISWLIKYFVITPFDAFLAQTLYRISRTSASIPFQAIFYEKAALKGAEADEFIIYREILTNISRCFLFLILAGLFFFVAKINIAFIIAAVLSLGFMFLGKPPKLNLSKPHLENFKEFNRIKKK